VEFSDQNFLKKLTYSGPVNCPTKGCHYFHTNKGALDRHVQQCNGKTKLKCSQKVYKEIDHAKYYKELIEEGILKPDFTPKHATVYWDAETFMQRNDLKISEKTTDICSHKLMMICYCAVNCDESYSSTNVIERDDDSPEGLRNLVDDFFNVLKNISEDHTSKLGVQFLNGLKRYREIVTDYKQIKQLSAEDQQKARAKFRILRTIQEVYVISYNGERYDHKLVIRELIDHIYDLDKNGPLWNKQHVIKRGAGYMLLSFDNIVFKDAINYTTPSSLQNFANSVGVRDNSKEIFPYEKFAKRLDAEKCENFPAYRDFHSSLWIPSSKFVEELNQMIRDGLIFTT